MKTRSRNIILTILLLAGLSACKKDDHAQDDLNMKEPVQVQVMVRSDDTRSVGNTGSDNDIRQLRVYAFNKQGVRVGYAESDNLSDQSYIYITLSEAGDIYFYVVANTDFGPNPNIDGQPVTDWSTLSASQLQKLKFGLSGFNGWPEINGEYISPMSNNRVDEEGNDMQYQNDFATLVNVISPATRTQIIPVSVQHVLGRLRLMLNKEAGNDDMTITVTRAAVYHRPDDFRLYLNGTAPASIDNYIKFDNNSDQLVDEFISADNPVELVEKPASQYTEIGRTFLAPNQFGTHDMSGSEFTDATGSPTEAGKDKAYRLEMTVKFEYMPASGVTPTVTTKNYTIYLPSVPRNTSIDIEGALSGTTDIQFNVLTNAWEEREMTIPPFQ